jgi:hypothetical protein
MQAHRLSYLKAVVLALAVCTASSAVVVCWLVQGRVGVPWTDWVLFESALPRWALTVGLMAIGLISLLVAVGGIFALRGDAKEVAAGSAASHPG